MALFQVKRFAAHRPSPLGLLALAAALTLLAALGGTAARYWKDWSDNSLVIAEDFYFTSKELGGQRYALPTDGERVEFSFTLQNYLVQGYHTPSDISYTCSLTDSAGDGVAGELRRKDGAADDGILPGGGNGPRELTYTIPKAAFGPEGKGELTVTVRSTKPYAATLTAQVTLGAQDVHLVVTDPGERYGAVAVTLYNTGTEACTGTLRWPTGDDPALAPLAPDPTWEVDPHKPLTVPAGEAVSVVFLKRSTLDSFTEGDFSFTS